ncbi:hypothetical protein DPX39_040087900 [Trypanosoma brucei equiperdum]|uniref:Variant surface glycoprotein n=1 Tax=Trypanosoma brucei equiperdum TaxID=630700 RepID=A0A3L6L7S1_9TRYP|nr:hypothetical protein DPX39_040087900 [Trypanosoma brucei equiperdum]
MAGPLTLLLLTTMRKIVSANTPGYDAAGSKATKSCDEIRYLLGVAGRIRQEADQNAKIADQMQTVATALKLAASMHQQPLRRAAFTARAITRAKAAAQAATAAVIANRKLHEAATPLAIRVHRTIIMRTLRIAKMTTGPAAEAANMEGKTQGHPQDTTVTTINQEQLTFIHNTDNCSINDLSRGNTIVSSNINHHAIYKLKLVDDNAITQAVITLKTARKNPTTGATAITTKPG